jgi:hypothetical protein
MENELKEKLFYRKVTHCNHCPNVGTDINGTRWVCKHKAHGYRVKMIEWLGWLGYGDTDVEIPDWCPLSSFPDILKENDLDTILQEFLTESEMKI